MRRALILGALLLAGCGGGDEPEPKLPGPQKGSAEERAIRGWSAALNRGDYDEAAAFFAPGALVEQGRSYRLRDREAAVAFNRSLPCRAELTDVEREGETLVAAFKLRAGSGPSQTCGGDARVSFRFREGKFSEWRQLAEPSEEEGDVI